MNTPEALPRRTLLKGAVALGGVALLPGCGTSDTTSEKLVVTDQRDKKISLSGPATRIVTLPMPAASIMIAVDRSAKHLVGIHDASFVAARDGILGTMFPQVLKVPHDVGTQDFAPNVEGILALKPDLVVQWASQGDEIVQPLENAGLSVLGVNYGKLEDVGAWFRMFSAALGKPERGQAMATRLDAGRAAVEAVAAKQTARAPRLLYFNRFSDSLTVQGAGTVQRGLRPPRRSRERLVRRQGPGGGRPRAGARLGPRDRGARQLRRRDARRRVRRPSVA